MHIYPGVLLFFEELGLGLDLNLEPKNHAWIYWLLFKWIFM